MSEKTNSTAVYYNLWGDEFPKLEKRAQAAPFPTSDMTVYIRQEDNDRAFMKRMSEFIFVGVGSLCRVNIGGFQFTDFKSFLEDLTRDYLNRTCANSGQGNQIAAEYVDHTKTLINGFFAERTKVDTRGVRLKANYAGELSCVLDRLLSEAKERLAVNEAPITVKPDSLKDYILPEYRDRADEVISCLKNLIDGRKGKVVATIMHAAVEVGIFEYEHARQFKLLQKELGVTGASEAFNKYYRAFEKYSNNIDKEDIDKMKQKILTSLKQ